MQSCIFINSSVSSERERDRGVTVPAVRRIPAAIKRLPGQGKSSCWTFLGTVIMTQPSSAGRWTGSAGHHRDRTGTWNSFPGYLAINCVSIHDVDHIKGLRYGALGPSSAHLCIDMQMMFADDTPWASKAPRSVLPAIQEVCRHQADATIFTRFLCPHDHRALPGQWRHFYSDCPQMLTADPRVFGIVSELHPFVPQGAVVSRYVFSVFADRTLGSLLEARGVDTLVFTGVETDVCVLASVLRAIDIGYRVIVVEDAVASSNKEGHEAALHGILPRFDQQVELVDVAQLLSAWQTPARLTLRRE
jgi:nicotinamidase-related amidase